MKELPILFSGPMVRALLDGRKTQTRRVLRDQQPIDLGAGKHGTHLSRRPVHNHGKPVGHRLAPVVCPYGVPDDRLWVRETFCFRGETTEGRDRYRYRADENPGTDGWRWTPAIHMPRAACRLRLEVTGVRVERLQDISEADALAEGFVVRQDISSDPEVHRDAARDWYMELWDSLNAARGFGWKENPWVWVIEFRRGNEQRPI